MPIFAMLGTGELLLILAILMLVFGASRLPAMGEGLGKAIRGLKRGLAADDDIDVTPAEKQVTPRSGATSATDEVAEADVVEHKRG